MTVYIISYDLSKLLKGYSGLYDAIKGFDNWWHYLDSTWMIKTSKDVKDVYDILRPHIHEDDNIIITELGKKRTGWLPKKAWEWIRKNE